MNQIKSWSSTCAVVMFLSLYLQSGMFCVNASAEDALADVSLARLHSDQKTQQVNEQWDDEERALRGRIATTTTTLRQLESHSQRLEHMITVEEQRMQQQQHRLVESQNLRDGLQLWLQDLVVQLQQTSSTTLPFLVAERDERIEALTAVVNDPYTSQDEQFRRVFEALLVEAEYGYSSEVYRDEIALAGEMIEVDLLRVGRLSLLFRTLDHQHVGMYDPEQQLYCWLPTENFSPISQAFAVVRHESAAQMVILPVGRIEKL